MIHGNVAEGSVHSAQGPWKLARVGRLELLRRFVVDRLLEYSSRCHKAEGLPVLAAVAREHIGRTIAVQGVYERELLEALCEFVLPRLVPESAQCVALDVGANIGNHSVCFARHFAEVVAFEPNPPVAAIFRANVLLNGIADRVRLFELGLSNVEDSIPFEPTVDNLGGSRFVGRDRVDVPALPVRPGDVIVGSLQLRGRVALIKLDVEGFELAAIEGLMKTIATHKPVLVFESHDASQSKRIAELIRSCGYGWLYAVETQRPAGSPTLLKRLHALLTGDTVSVSAIREFETRYYPMVVATTTPLEPVHLVRERGS